MAILICKAGWRCALEENGELFVPITGDAENPLCSADSWAIEVVLMINAF